MKKSKRLLLIISIVIAIVAMASFMHFKNTNNHIPVVLEPLRNNRFAVVSDVHITSKDPDNKNAIEDVNLDIIDALKAELINEDISFLVLCGDNTNSSQAYQNKALKKKLDEFKDAGIEVILIPGNHDIGSLKREEFSDYYKDYGYLSAYSLDANSLSYSYVKGKQMFLMLDTDGYTDYQNAILSHKTLDWIRKQLIAAKENDYKVITVGHFPVITEHATGFIGKEELLSLFRKYEMPLYISGHLHNRNVNIKDGVAELVVDKLTSYPCNYAIIEIKEDEIIYMPKNLDLSSYGLNDLALDFELEREDMGRYVVDVLCSDFPDTDTGDRILAADYFTKLMACLSEGSVYRNMDELICHPGAGIFKRIASKSNYGPWLPVLFEKANPYTEGFVIKNGTINETLSFD